MAEQKYVEFLNRLIFDTKRKKMTWKYLDTNKELYEGMGWTRVATEFSWLTPNKGKVLIDFDDEDSFFAKIDDTYIVIYVRGNQPAMLYIVPETYKKILLLSPDEYGDKITRLLNLVQSQFPNAEAFVDSFLKTQYE